MKEEQVFFKGAAIRIADGTRKGPGVKCQESQKFGMTNLNINLISKSSFLCLSLLVIR